MPVNKAKGAASRPVLRTGGHRPARRRDEVAGTHALSLRTGESSQTGPIRPASRDDPRLTLAHHIEPLLTTKTSDAHLSTEPMLTIKTLAAYLSVSAVHAAAWVVLHVLGIRA